MDQRIIDLYDRFTHGGMNRRVFLDRLAQIAGSSAAALALLPLLQNDYARAAIVAPDDARLAIDSVSYDAAQPPAELVKSIQAPLLLHYAGLDQRINAGIPAYEAALKAAGKRFAVHVYPYVNHAFNNDTGNRYDKAAADLAWSRSIAFFKENLGAPPKA